VIKSIEYLRSRCCHGPNLRTLQKDWQNAGVIEAQFGTNGDAEALNVAIQSHHTVSCDWDSAFDFRRALTSTMDQRA